MRRRIFLLVILLAVCVGTFHQPQATQQASTTPSRQQALAQALKSVIPPLPPLQVERTIALKRGDTLAGALAGAGFSRAQIAALVASHPAAKQPIGAATQLNLSYTESTPRNIATASLAYRPTPTLALQLNLDESSATAQATNKPLRQTQGIAVGVIADSLYEDAILTIRGIFIPVISLR
ncbi:hypothetical protein EBZ39_12655 [bacterium]|nr:hypothetical protein [bacterium]